MGGYTTSDDENLVSYLSEVGLQERLNNRIYEDLVAQGNAEKWPWSHRNTAESWLSRYRTRQAYFDSRIERYIQSKNKSYSSPPIITLQGEGLRQRKVNQEPFNEEQSAGLAKFRERDDIRVSKRPLFEESEKESDIEIQSAKIPRTSPHSTGSLYADPENSNSLIEKDHISIKSTPPPHTQGESRSPSAPLPLRSSVSARNEGVSSTYEDTVSNKGDKSPTAPLSPRTYAQLPPNGNDIFRQFSSKQPISLSCRKPLALAKLKPKKTPSVPELSEEDPFASVPPSPKHISNVFYEPPRPRSHATFRDTARVRDRVVVDGPIVRARKKQKLSHMDQNQDRFPIIEVTKSDSRASAQPASVVETLLAARKEPRHVLLDNPDIYKPGTIPMKAAHLNDIYDGNSLSAFPSTNDDIEKDADVFSNQEGMTSATPPDRYVLKTSYLKEPQTASSPPAMPSSPILRKKRSQEDLKSRRRTFGGFSSGFPHINLLERLPKRRPAESPIPVLRREQSPPASKSSRLIAPGRKARPVASTPPAHLRNELSVDQTHGLAKLSPASFKLILEMGLGTLFKQLEENHGFSQDVIRRVWRAQNMDLHATDRMLLKMRVAAERAATVTDSEDEANLVPAVADNSSLRHEKELFREPAELQDEYTPPAKTKAFKYRRLSEHKRHKEQLERELSSPRPVILATGPLSSPHEQAQRKLVSPPIPPEVILVEPKSQRRSGMMARTIPNTVDHNLVQNMLRSKRPATALVWGEEEEEALRSNDEKKMKELAEKFGEGVVLQRFMANIGI